MRPTVGLIDNPYAAKQSPLVIDFQRGHVVVFGASGWGKTTFIRSTVVSLAATHSPDQFHAYILDLGGRNLVTLAKLPQVGAVVIPDEAGYKERTEQVIKELDNIIENRKKLLSTANVGDLYAYNEANPDAPLPAILLAIDNFLEFVETFGGNIDDPTSVLNQFVGLARQSKAYGIHVIITASQLSDLSGQLYSLFTERYTLKMTENSDYRAIVGAQVADIPDVAGRGYARHDRQALSFQVATLVKPENEAKRLDDYIANMNAYVARSGAPTTCPCAWTRCRRRCCSGTCWHARTICRSTRPSWIGCARSRASGGRIASNPPNPTGSTSPSAWGRATTPATCTLKPSATACMA